MSGKDAKRRIPRKSDRLSWAALLIGLVAGVALFLALPLLDRVGYAQSAAALVTPFLAVGVWEALAAKRWVMAAVLVVVPAILYAIDWRLGFLGAAVLPGSIGMAAFADMVQRRIVVGILRSAEGRCTKAKASLHDRCVAFVYNLPEGFDGRGIRVPASARRKDAKVTAMAATSCLALVPVMFVCMLAAGLASDGSTWSDVLVPAVTATVYAAALAMPLVCVAELGATVERPGAEHLFLKGLSRTAVVMLVPSAVALVIVVAVSSPSLGTVGSLIATVVLCVVFQTIAMSYYVREREPDFVRDVSSAWSEDRPTWFYAGGGSGGSVGDGVPGTPVRPQDSCFPDRKNRSLWAEFILPAPSRDLKMGLNTSPDDIPGVLLSPIISGSSQLVMITW